MGDVGLCYVFVSFACIYLSVIYVYVWFLRWVWLDVICLFDFFDWFFVDWWFELLAVGSSFVDFFVELWFTCLFGWASAGLLCLIVV